MKYDKINYDIKKFLLFKQYYPELYNMRYSFTKEEYDNIYNMLDSGELELMELAKQLIISKRKDERIQDESNANEI